MREIVPGRKYKHFKGMIVEVLFIALDSESKRKKVVYNENGQIWVRDYDMFISLVDKKKYPDVTQKYRFEDIL